MTTEIQQKPKSAAQSAMELAQSRTFDLTQLAGNAESLGARIVVAYGQAMRLNPDIAMCTPESRNAALYKVAALNLDCSGATGQVWLVPLKDKGILKLNVWIGVQGMLELARRSGKVRSVNVGTVREGDVFRYVPTDTANPLYHEPKSGTARIVAFWAQVELHGGGKETAVVWEDEFAALQRDGLAKSSSGPWGKFPDRMVQLVALRRALKRAPKSILPLPPQFAVDDDGVVMRQSAIGRDAGEFAAETLALTSEPDAEVSSDDA